MNVKSKKNIILRAKNSDDLPWLSDHINKHWGGEPLVVRGKKFYPSQMDGIMAVQGDHIIGFIFYYMQNQECEIIVCEVLDKFKGIGTFLLNEVKRITKNHKCRRLFLMTTNDNLDALRFYQKRGFNICGIHLDSVKNSRKIKPSIGLIGDYGIPVRDEIDLELQLGS